MTGWTNRGKNATLEVVFRGVTRPTNYYIVLVTSATAPSDTTNLLSDLTEIAAGNGYTAGGIQVTPNSTDWDVLTEDDTNHLALIQLKDLTWTATGGSLPASGNGARYAVLTSDEATQANRRVWIFWDLTADRSVSVGQPLTLQNCEARLTE